MAYFNKSKKQENQSIANDSAQLESQGNNFEDSSPEAIQMRQFQSNIDNSDEVKQMMSFQDASENYRRVSFEIQIRQDCYPQSGIRTNMHVCIYVRM